MFLIYQHAGGIGGTHANLQPQPVLVEPAVYETVTTPGPVISYEMRDENDEVTSEEVRLPDVSEERLVSSEVYREETTDEVVERMLSAGMLPNAPWSDWVLVPSDDPLAGIAPSRLQIADWNNPQSITVLPETYSADRLKEHASARRRAVIAGGTAVQVGSQTVPTWADPDTQSALTGLVVAAQAGLLSQAISWRGRDGVFYSIPPEDVVDLAQGVMSFVQHAFGIEAYLTAGIDSGSVTTPAAIDSAPWPG